jgi:hypothetical protein
MVSLSHGESRRGTLAEKPVAGQGERKCQAQAWARFEKAAIRTRAVKRSRRQSGRKLGGVPQLSWFRRCADDAPAQ